MGIGKQIALIPLTGCSVTDLVTALLQMIGTANLACPVGQWGGSTTVYVTDGEGVQPDGVELIEETLSDGSKAYNVVLRFPEVA